MLFIRYGGLSSVRQKGYDASMPTFHSPPARRGIYAFPWPHVEYFLLGSSVFIPQRMVWLRDKSGARIDIKHPDYWKLADKSGVFDVRDSEDKPSGSWLAKHVKPKKFDYDGLIWCHLSIKAHAIIDRKGSWFLTDMASYSKALRKELGLVQRMNTVKDHLEVFIEKI